MLGSKGVRAALIWEKRWKPLWCWLFQHSDPVNENHSLHSETFDSSGIPAGSVQTQSSRQATVGTMLTLNYTERFGESRRGTSVPVLGVKGLISRSWFEERNCFFVCSYSLCRDEPRRWKPLANTSREEMERFPPLRSLSDVCVQVGVPSSCPLTEKLHSSISPRHQTPAELLMCDKTLSSFNAQKSHLRKCAVDKTVALLVSKISIQSLSGLAFYPLFWRSRTECDRTRLLSFCMAYGKHACHI